MLEGDEMSGVTFRTYLRPPRPARRGLAEGPEEDLNV